MKGQGSNIRRAMTGKPRYHSPPDLADIEEMAADALETIPEPLRRYVDGVAIRVLDFPDAETLSEMGCTSEFDLLGLYRGISLDRKSVYQVVQDVDMIFLYRRPLLEYWCETGEDLAAIIRHVLIHEVGHHFGFSDEDMKIIEARA